MSIKQRDYYIRKRFIGFDLINTSDPLNNFSEAYICPKCGTDWCRSIIPDAEWMPLRKPCPHCSDPFMVLQYGDAIPWGREPAQTMKTASPGLLNYILLQLLDAKAALLQNGGDNSAL